MHGSYRRAFGPESVVELHKNITVQHEDYLKQDDPDKKADALRYMAGYVVQYLYLVPQDKKFTYKETDRVLHNSAMNIAEFDPREGSIAFQNLAKYAENLLEQPWRKDFHVIKLTSGFYVHNIAAQLQNAHEILIVMGYVNIDDTTLKLVPNKKRISNLKAVSRDCHIASQECLILSQIWQHVADQEPDYPLTIGEVFEYRKNHLGDTETICNKLLYDIRARMHAAKQHQQLKYMHHQQQSALKNTQRFVPVDRLIDYDADDGPNPDEPDAPHHNFYPEREVERTHEQFKNMNMYAYKDDEHIYDPVCGEDRPLVPSHGVHRKLSHPAASQQQQKLASNVPPQYHYNNAGRKSMPVVVQPPQYHVLQQQQQQFHHNNFSTNNTNNVMYSAGSDRNSVSPMIPKTVTSFFASNSSNSGSRNNVSKSNSMNSINGSRGAPSSSSSSSMSQNFGNQALIRTKVKETDIDADLVSPRDAIPPYYNGVNDNRSLRARKSMPASIPQPQNNFSNHSNQVYPDQFYPPGIVKPVAVYGSPANNPSMRGYQQQRARLHSDNSEDVLNEAYAYASEVGQLPKGAQALIPRSSQVSTTTISGQQEPPYQHKATPIPLVHGSDSESHSESNKPRNSSVPRELVVQERITNAIRSGSSTDASSSWEGSVRLRKSETPPKRPSHIDLQRQIRHADSSPESDQVQSKNKNGYRELSSSSSAGSPATTPSRNYPRNDELNSLDTVYYDYLLKQGQTDEVLGGSGGRSNINDTEAIQQHHQTRRSGSRTQERDRGSSSHHQNNYSSESEETHMYDGRRVVPKRHNDTVSRKKQNPVESSVGKSDPNYNLLSGKPSNEKNVRKSINHHPQSNRVPDESEDPAPPIKVVEPWSCRFCTFRNLIEERVCEVCAKSKDFYEDLDPTPTTSGAAAPIPIASSSQLPNSIQQQNVLFPKMYSVPSNPVPPPGVSSGAAEPEEEERECPQCTLLNPARARVCDACNFRLKPVDSPKSLEELAVAMDNR